MKKYETPVVDITKLDVEDVIATSPVCDNQTEKG